jgi:hypothetical protein
MARAMVLVRKIDVLRAFAILLAICLMVGQWGVIGHAFTFILVTLEASAAGIREPLSGDINGRGDSNHSDAFSGTHTPKDIYMYWAQESLPEFVELVAKSWKTKNPSWSFHLISDSTLHTYIGNSTVLSMLSRQESLQFKSDIVRTNLLADHGGVYVDADVLSATPLDQWLERMMTAGFFAFRSEPASSTIKRQALDPHNAVCSSWFLAAGRSSYIMSALKIALNEYAMTRTKPETYFQWHYIFTKLTTVDSKFKQFWDVAPLIYSSHFVIGNRPKHTKKECVIGLRYLQRGTTLGSTLCGFLFTQERFCMTVRELIDSRCSPVYKLKYDGRPEQMNIARYIASEGVTDSVFTTMLSRADYYFPLAGLI